MTPRELLDRLDACGVKLRVIGTRIEFNAPSGAIDAYLKQLMTEHKLELMELIRERSFAVESALNARDQSHAGALAQHVQPFFDSIGGVVNEMFDSACLEGATAGYVRHINPTLAGLFHLLGLDKTYVRGQGTTLFDSEGRDYLDAIAQFGALPFGHNPQAIWDEIARFRDRQEPAFVSQAIPVAAAELAEQLVEITPVGLNNVVFTNSGAEAVEVAIKLCRYATGRVGVLSCRGGFHGLTMAAMSATGSSYYCEGFGPRMDNFDVIPFGEIGALADRLESYPNRYAALLVEPIQGEGGIHVAPDGYLNTAHKLCSQAGVQLIVDEIQTGLGRTGHLFYSQSLGLNPDVLLCAKALGGGLVPIGAVLYSDVLRSPGFDLRHSSTFAGNALSCRVASATLEILTDRGLRLTDQVQMNGIYLGNRLRAMAAKHHEFVKEIRGCGYIWGVEFDFSRLTHRPGLIALLAQRGLLTGCIVSFALANSQVRLSPPSITQVIRIEPPLIATKGECDRIVESIEAACQTIKANDASALLRHLATETMPLRTRSQDFLGRDQTFRQITAQLDSEPSFDTMPGDRFAFVVHFLKITDFALFDPSLSELTPKELRYLRDRLVAASGPIPIGEIRVESKTGQVAYGEIIVVPFDTEELLAMRSNEAIRWVEWAFEIGSHRGAKVVGLGGFTSIVTNGGTALPKSRRTICTSGNALTAAMAVEAVIDAVERSGRKMSDVTIAVVGAAGVIGRAMSQKLAQLVGALCLVGRGGGSDLAQHRLIDVATSCIQSVWTIDATNRTQSLGTLAKVIQQQATCIDAVQLATAWAQSDGPISVSWDPNDATRMADVTITATSSPEPIIDIAAPKQGAILCDVSRPYNIADEIVKVRPDIQLVRGGQVALPGNPELGPLTQDVRGVLVACASETILLALESAKDDLGHRGDWCGQLSPFQLEVIERSAIKHGFRLHHPKT
ncbi:MULTISPECIES: aminotransferase class III-fold pyridoxal phosphate-dependent enzyme [Pirellulaceae]|nr:MULTISPECIES: aminotransferase class III-fold pyridoxal phosphate-dependent enzyme [Pirellulaceae]